MTPYETHHIVSLVRKERVARDLSQRDLSELTGVPQAQISRIESGQVDLRFSTLVALANALDLEVTLVPRRAMPAVKSVIGVAETDLNSEPARPAYTLDEVEDV